MKTTTVARGFMGAVASLLGVVAVGCSADGGWEGAAGEGEIGSVEQALSGTAPVKATVADISGIDIDPNTGGTQAPVREFAGHCVINDDGVDKLAVFGGFNAAGAALDDILIFDPSGTPSWTRLPVAAGTKLTQARGSLKGIQLPSDDSKCLIVGGESTNLGGTTYTTVEELSVSSGTFTVTAKDPLNVARAKHELQVCGNNIIAVGGEQAGAVFTSDSVEIYNVAGNQWDTNSTTSGDIENLGQGRYDFAMAKDDSNDRYVVGGGNNAGGVLLRTVEVFTSANSCTDMDVKAFPLTERLGTARDGLVAHIKPGSSSVFAFLAGNAAGTASAAVDEVSVTSWTANSQTISTNTSPSGYTLTATAYPMLATDLGATPETYMLVGGESVPGTTTFATNAIQEWDSMGSPDQFLTASLSGSGRTHGVAAYLPSANRVITATGVSIASPGTKTFLTSADQITP
jgi:hypothetical protein